VNGNTLMVRRSLWAGLMTGSQMRFAAFCILVFCFPDCALAGFCNASPNADPRHDFAFLAGYSPGSSTWIGTTKHRRFVMAGFSYSYRCWAANGVDISYTASLLPVAIVLQPTLPAFRSTPTGAREIPAHAVYGVGLLPLGFAFHFRRHARVQPFADAHGGIIASTEPVPVDAPDATGLNFLFDFGAGIRWKLGNRRAISFGYKFLHISNASTTRFNPGVDNNVLFASFSLLR
jgi:hypothetical protein